MKRYFSGLQRIWLPLFLLSGLSWLFAPAYYHDHFGSLQLISTYESGLRDWSWLFRAGDVVSGSLLVLAPWLFRFWRADRRLSWLVVAVGILSVIDGLFGATCGGSASCSGLPHLVNTVHDVESVLIVVVLTSLALFHAWKYQFWQTYALLGSQLVIGLADSSGLLDRQAIIVSQYAYEVLTICWLAWLVNGRATLAPNRHAQLVRRAFGVWTLVNGTIALIVTLTHHRLLAPLFDISLSHSSAIVGGHGVIAGVLMLYLARHVYQGQRRAALLLALVFGSQVIKYSVLTPSPVLLAVNLLSLMLLLYSHRAFDKNILPLPMLARVKDVAIVFGGALLAILVSLVISTAAGHGTPLHDGLIDSYQGSLHLAHHDRVRLQRQLHRRTEAVVDTLGVALLAVTVWSLFRPTRLIGRASTDDVERARELLERYSTSTEDYFKLWPTDKAYFFAHAGFVAYKLVGSSAFVLADPVAKANETPLLLQAFVRHCRNHGWSMCVLSIPATSKRLYADQGFKIVKIGSSAVIDIQAFADETSRDKWWRWQRNRGNKARLHYRLAVPPHAAELVNELRTVSDVWLQDGEHREQGFALGYFDEQYLADCRLHLLRDASGQLVGFTNELPVFGDQSQRTVDLIRYVPGQNGAMPFLLLHVIEQLQSEGAAKTFDLGFVPLAGIDSNLLRIVRRLAAGRFSSLGLEQFKNKFDPNWQASYLAYDGDLLDLARIATSLEAVLKKTD